MNLKMCTFQITKILVELFMSKLDGLISPSPDSDDSKRFLKGGRGRRDKEYSYE